MKLGWTAVLLVLLVGCSPASRVVRLDTGQTETHVFIPRSGAGPVALKDTEFKEAVAKLARDVRLPSQPQDAARRLFEVGARSGSYQYEPRARRITPFGPGEQLEGVPSAADVELKRAYLRWCERTGRPGDCLSLLEESPILNGDGRFALALALAQGAVLDEMLEAFKDMADPHAMVAAVLWTWTTYMVLLAVPEPFSKGLAAVMTATLISYVGVDTFWGLIVGFKRLMEDADRATTFNELREAGERYGKVMGRNAARAFAMLATAAIGNTAPGLAAKVPTLPGAVRAAAQAESQVGIRLAAVGQVQTVAVSAEAVTIALAPGAVAMSAEGGSSQGPFRTDSASSARLFENQNPRLLSSELATAQRLGIRSARVTDPEFTRYVNEGRVKWIVTPEGELRIIPHTWQGEELAHTVASGGRPVLAAGEADIAVHGSTRIGLDITPHSGHYLHGSSEAVSVAVLEIGRQAFARVGIIFPP